MQKLKNFIPNVLGPRVPFYSRTCHLIFPSIRTPLNMLTTNRILHNLTCLVGLHKLDLYIYTTTNKCPNIKQLSWAINHCACWPQTKSCTSSPAWLGGFHKKRLWRAAVAGKWTRIFASFERSPLRRALFACFSTNSLPAPPSLLISALASVHL